MTGAPGEVLRDTREDAGITQREVADALNLPMATVEALEAGDEEQLPAAVFTRGYVRAYAKLLELDPEPLMAAMGDDTEESPLLDTGAPSPSSARTSAVNLQNGLQPKYIAALIAIVVVIALLTMWLMSNGEPDQTTAVPELSAELEPGNQRPSVESPGQRQMTALEDTQADVQSDAAEVPAGAATGRAALDLDTVDAGSDSVSEPVNEIRTDDTPADQVTAEIAASPALDDQATAAVASSDTARRLTADGTDKLRLLFTEECWVEIKTTDGRTLFGDLGRAGQSLEFVGRAPFKVLLGYAPGALLEFNDEPVALSPHTRNNVASLVLGQ